MKAVEGTEALATECLLPRIALGDQRAVTECISRYGGLVWSLARRFLGNPADAEDAVQDVFVDLWKNAAKFDPTKSAEPTFVTMVTRRRLIDRKRRTARVPASAPLDMDIPGKPDNRERLTEISDDAARAATALGELKDDQRRVIGMAIYQGFTHEEIAAATGMPLGTVKTHIRRGLIRMRGLLGGGEE